MDISWKKTYFIPGHLEHLRKLIGFMTFIFVKNSLYGSDASILSAFFSNYDRVWPLPPLNKCLKSNCFLRKGLRLKMRLVLILALTLRLIANVS
ncbi:hypothetical protein ACFTAO_13375 [Paenibacillus rhizoplanae]